MSLMGVWSLSGLIDKIAEAVANFELSFVAVWALYKFFGVCAFCAAFIWAVRTRQFTQFDRQRRMALDVEDFIEDPPDRLAPRADRYILLVLAFLAFAAIASAMLVGAAGP